MEFISSSSTIFAFLALFLLSLLWMSFTYVLQSKDRQNKSSPPEAAGAWPLIGHLPLLGGPNPAHITLGNMADKYGTLFKIQLGVYPTLVVSGWEVAKECLTTHDRLLATRPKSLFGEIMGYGYTMLGFSPYGPYWRQVRKTATVELLSNHKLELLKHVREFEVKVCTKEIYDMWEENKSDPGQDSDHKVLVEMERWFGDVTMNLMIRVVFGKRFMKMSTVEAEKEKKEICWKAVKQFFKLGGEFPLADAVPFLRWLDFGGIEKAMKKTAEDFDGMLQGWLEEHKQKRSGDGELDFMDMMLSVVEDSAQDRHGLTTADTITKSTCLAILLGGTDTTMVTLTWALSLLLNNREALKKAQDELDNNVGREKQVQESDLKSLVYLQAIIKETMRLYPAAPLSVPHEAAEDCTIGGYNVPAGTRFIFNLTKIMSDPNVWVDPGQFRPERFLTTHKDFDVRGQNFEFIPFGSGRRICPGISFALQVMQLTLAQLLHGFEISATSADGGVDMGLTPGLTIMRKTPLKVLIRPRLPAKVYEC